MIDKTELAKVVAAFKYDWTSGNVDWLPGEIYKLKAIKTFQDNWDIEAADFAAMLKRSLKDTENLLASAKYFPQEMLLIFAEEFPEEVRGMFHTLFDESADVAQRIAAFKQQSEGLLVRHFKGPTNRGHYQDEKAITTYLWLRYPDDYYIYQYSVEKKISDALSSGYEFKKGAYTANIQNFIRMNDEICAELKKGTELIELTRSHLGSDYYPDPELKTLTTDIGFYIVQVDSERRYWIYSPGNNAENWNEFHDSGMMAIGWDFLGDLREFSGQEEITKEMQEVSSDESSHKNDVLATWQFAKEIKPGDIIFAKKGLQKLVGCGVVESDYIFDDTRAAYKHVRKVKWTHKGEWQYPGTAPMKTLTDLTPFPDTVQQLLDLIREENPKPVSAAPVPVSVYDKRAFLSDVFMTEQRYDALAAVLKRKKNIILQGAPGVGKTFAARRLAWSMMGEQDDSRIEFVQFHQNYSYEDFVMGYKPVEDGFKLKYGVFYRFCQKASNQPDQDFYFIIDEINRGNMSKIFGELLMLIEKDYRGKPLTLAYDGRAFSVPERLHIIGMMNTADRSLAMIDYALRRRFSFFEMEPGFDSDGFRAYQNGLGNDTLNRLIEKVKLLNEEIVKDKSLGKGFCIGHSYFCGQDTCTDEWLHAVVDYDILPMLEEYWFDDESKYQQWKKELQGVFHDEA